MKRELRSHSEVLEALASVLDIPEDHREYAEKQYKNLGSWLERAESKTSTHKPKIYPQGSFLLGTVVRPVNGSDDYDLDLVCKINMTKREITMAELKTLIGVDIHAYAQNSDHGIKGPPKDGRRCWTLNYAGKANFHIDILPSIPDEQGYQLIAEGGLKMSEKEKQALRKHAIAITDKTHDDFKNNTNEWPVSNPWGYWIWFRQRQEEVINKRKKVLFEANRNAFSSVEDIPDYKVKTPLQIVIQLLKRHRDVMFDGRDDKPISMIITTLAAHAYGGEEDIGEALRAILKTMGNFIEDRRDGKWVANPVNPEENFADKWAEDEEKEKAFFAWLAQANKDFGSYFSVEHHKIPAAFKKCMSEKSFDLIAVSFAIVAGVSAPAVHTAAETQKETIIESGAQTKPWARSK